MEVVLLPWGNFYIQEDNRIQKSEESEGRKETNRNLCLLEACLGMFMFPCGHYLQGTIAESNLKITEEHSNLLWQSVMKPDMEVSLFSARKSQDNLNILLLLDW